VKPHPLLAMDVNDDAGCLNARVARTFIASRLAPTVNPVHLQVTGRLSGRRSAISKCGRPGCGKDQTDKVHFIRQSPCRSEPARDGRQR